MTLACWAKLKKPADMRVPRLRTAILHLIASTRPPSAGLTPKPDTGSRRAVQRTDASRPLKVPPRDIW